MAKQPSKWCEDKAAEMMRLNRFDEAGDYLVLADEWKRRGL